MQVDANATEKHPTEVEWLRAIYGTNRQAAALLTAVRELIADQRPDTLTIERIDDIEFGLTAIREMVLQAGDSVESFMNEMERREQQAAAISE